MDYVNSLTVNSSENLFNYTSEVTSKFEQFNSTNYKLLYSPLVTAIIAVVATIMSAITICGNILVITAFIIDKNLRKYSNYFILNLSIADLLIGLLIPPYAPFLIYNRVWKLGKVACTTWLVLDYVVGSASVLCIVVISLDRFLLVSKGLSYLNEQKISKAIYIMITVWMIAFINYAPAIIFWELIWGVNSTKEGECQVAFHNHLFYLTATACVEFFVPLISICALNLAVYLNIRKRSRGLIRSKNSNKDSEITLRKVVDIEKVKAPLLKTNIENNENNQNESIEYIFENNQNNIVLFETTLSNQAENSKASSPSTKSAKYNQKRKSNIQMTSRAFLSKDKKAARSLFILVFVFVICWVLFCINKYFLNPININCKLLPILFYNNSIFYLNKN